MLSSINHSFLVLLKICGIEFILLGKQFPCLSIASDDDEMGKAKLLELVAGHHVSPIQAITPKLTEDKEKIFGIDNEKEKQK